MAAELAGTAGRCLFMDMNSFFASVEQQERAELRGKPIIVAPLLSDSTCAIAASYEAKALGIKTGTSVRMARRICPDIEVVEARPKVYRDYHAAIVEMLEAHFATIKVLSVDEMVCKVGRTDTGPERERELAARIKSDVQTKVGNTMRCSVGIAPNVFLAKVASDRQKPDGLTIYKSCEVPGALHGLELLDLPGIGPRMATRLERHGIRTVRQLCAASASDLRRAWGSVVGARWWYMLRGSQTVDYGMYQTDVRKSVGHSHVLPPRFRTREGVSQILMRLFSRALRRLRSYGQAAGRVTVYADFRALPSGSFREGNWDTYSWSHSSRGHIPANDEMTWIKTIRKLGEAIPLAKPGYAPLRVGIVFSDLLACQDVNLELFEDGRERAKLMATVDAINETHGYVLDLASVWWLQGEAPERLAFGRPDSGKNGKKGERKKDRKTAGQAALPFLL